MIINLTTSQSKNLTNALINWIKITTTPIYSNRPIESTINLINVQPLLHTLNMPTSPTSLNFMIKQSTTRIMLLIKYRLRDLFIALSTGRIPHGSKAPPPTTSNLKPKGGSMMWEVSISPIRPILYHFMGIQPMAITISLIKSKFIRLHLTGDIRLILPASKEKVVIDRYFLHYSAI